MHWNFQDNSEFNHKHSRQFGRYIFFCLPWSVFHLTDHCHSLQFVLEFVQLIDWYEIKVLIFQNIFDILQFNTFFECKFKTSAKMLEIPTIHQCIYFSAAVKNRNWAWNRIAIDWKCFHNELLLRNIVSILSKAFSLYKLLLEWITFLLGKHTFLIISVLRAIVVQKLRFWKFQLKVEIVAILSKFNAIGNRTN